MPPVSGGKKPMSSFLLKLHFLNKWSKWLFSDGSCQYSFIFYVKLALEKSLHPLQVGLVENPRPVEGVGEDGVSLYMACLLGPCDCDPTSEPQAASSRQNSSNKAGSCHSFSEEFTTPGDNQNLQALSSSSRAQNQCQASSKASSFGVQLRPTVPEQL